MHLGMQRFDPAIEHLWKASIRTQLHHRNACLAQRLGRASGRDQFHSPLNQCFCQWDQARLVRDGEQGTLNFCHAGKLEVCPAGINLEPDCQRRKKLTA